MRSNIVLWWVIAGFFFLMAIVYTVWNILDSPGEPLVQQIEWAGSTALTFTGFMGVLIAYYIGKVYKAQNGELPEDILTSDIDDGDPEVGEFSPWSWWPVTLAGAAALVILGLAVGQWIMYIGAAVVLVALVGWVYEYYRGHFAR